MYDLAFQELHWATTKIALRLELLTFSEFRFPKLQGHYVCVADEFVKLLTGHHAGSSFGLDLPSTQVLKSLYRAKASSGKFVPPLLHKKIVRLFGAIIGYGISKFDNRTGVAQAFSLLNETLRLYRSETSF
ncbi:hypothetical protein DB345_09955 [Spartobacteria bacterium LR76]|nr:hypothetical protein DB345_09955 [Spartobacteria bacterium LR76]